MYSSEINLNTQTLKLMLKNIYISATISTKTTAAA